jgi:hypothetical protein
VNVRRLFVVGLALLVVGAVLFFWQFPHSGAEWVGMPAGAADGHSDWSMGWQDHGSLRWSLFGAAIAGAGFLVILAPIIAWGVRLGLALGQPDRS